MKNTIEILGGCALLTLACTGSYAHHATGPVYDRSQTVEMEGEVTEVFWRNPHIGFTVAGVDSSGAARTLDIETNSVSIVSRFGLTPGLVSPGTRVTVAGNPGRISDDALWLTNMLLPSGEEILFGARYQPRWSDQTIGEDIRGEITADIDNLGIFRVWTSGGGGGSLWNSSYPLTPAALAVRAEYDPVRDDPTQNCAPKGMPYIMEQPYPMQLVDEGDVIVMRMEEYDTVRRFYMSADEVDDAAPNLLGHSVGRWDGATLVVETTGIDYEFFNNSGIRQSPSVQTVERFTLNDDGSELNYQMTVTDPATFTEPVELDKSWVWRPGEQVRPYDCALTD